MDHYAHGVSAFVALAAAALVLAMLAERMRLPASVALVACGALAQTTGLGLTLPFAFGPALLFVFLPPLVFEAAWALDAGALRRTAGAIALLAVPGVAVTVAAIGWSMAALGVLPLPSALVFGAIVAATDPVAVIATFRRLRVPVELATIVEGESLANDGVALLAYGLALAYARGVAVPTSGALAGALSLQILGGCGIGALVAAAVTFLIRRTDEAPSEILATIVVAYGSYAAASALGVSAIFATASAAITLHTIQRRSVPISELTQVEGFWSVLVAIVNAVVFLATGLSLRAERMSQYGATAAFAVGIVLGARALIAFGLFRFSRHGRGAAGWRVMVFVAGMRGGLATALALSLPSDLPARGGIVAATFAVVLVTLVVQGVLLGPLTTRLRLGRS